MARGGGIISIMSTKKTVNKESELSAFQKYRMDRDVDERKLFQIVTEGRELCKKCRGTGNQAPFWQEECTQCGGTGYLGKLAKGRKYFIEGVNTDMKGIVTEKFIKKLWSDFHISQRYSLKQMIEWFEKEDIRVLDKSRNNTEPHYVG